MLKREGEWGYDNISKRYPDLKLSIEFGPKLSIYHIFLNFTIITLGWGFLILIVKDLRTRMSYHLFFTFE